MARPPLSQESTIVYFVTEVCQFALVNFKSLLKFAPLTVAVSLIVVFGLAVTFTVIWMTAPIAFLPAKSVPAPTLGRISPDDVNYALYRGHLSRTTDEPFALFLPR